MVGIFVPGVVLLFGVTAVAGSGVLGLWTTLSVGFVGAVLGDALSYWVGRYLHEDVRSLGPFARHPQWIDNGERFFERHGGKSIFLGRFVGPIRPFIPMIAGMLDMSWRRFLFINLFSAVVWAPAYLLPGYLLGASLRLEPDAMTRLLQLAGGALLGGWMALWLLRQAHLWLSPEGRGYAWVQQGATRFRTSAALWRVAGWSKEPPGLPLAGLVLAGVLLVLLVLALVANQYAFTPVRVWLSATDGPRVDQFFGVVAACATPIGWQAALVWTAVVLALRGASAAAGISVALALGAGLVHGLIGADPLWVVTLGLGWMGYLGAQRLWVGDRWMVYSGIAAGLAVLSIARLYMANQDWAHGAVVVVGGSLVVQVLVLCHHPRHLELRPGSGLSRQDWVWLGGVVACAGLGAVAAVCGLLAHT